MRLDPNDLYLSIVAAAFGVTVERLGELLHEAHIQQARRRVKEAFYRSLYRRMQFDEDFRQTLRRDAAAYDGQTP